MTLFLTVARTLATFNIHKQIDRDGVEIVPEVRYSGETLRCGIKSRYGVWITEKRNLATHFRSHLSYRHGRRRRFHC